MEAPYGSWNSPIKAEIVGSASLRFGEIVVGDSIYWIESRPLEKGRSTVMQFRDGTVKEILPQEFNARTRVHEYGGGSIALSGDSLCFIHFADQHLYALDLKNNQVTLILDTPNCRYADFHYFEGGFYCVREEHFETGEPKNSLVFIDLKKREEQVVQSGEDFYSSPKVCGSKLLWLSWNHPNMPWDGTTLYVADIEKDKSVRSKVKVAGGEGESIFQPEWGANGDLYFVSDRTLWWNLYRFRQGKIEALCPMEAEFGLPGWVFGMSTYALVDDNTIACLYRKKGADHLSLIDLSTKKLKEIPLPYQTLSGLKGINHQLYFYAASPATPTALIQVDLKTLTNSIIRTSMPVEVDSKALSMPKAIVFPTAHNQMAYANYYPPHNPDYRANKGELPPLLLLCHGGPTTQCSTALRLEIQFFTSRGYAVLDLDYAGSSGYGRAYRNRLKGNWGIADVEDAVASVRYLVDEGLVDSNRVIIKGGSAGGYTVLRALTTTSIFTAGTSYYGVSDLESLAKETHKFEAHYLDGLIGAENYHERSPINHLDQFDSSLLILQGMQDKVVLPNQSEMMFNAIKKKGLPVAYLTFDNEQHGFRRSENIQRALEAELYFYSRILNIPILEKINPITIENL